MIFKCGRLLKDPMSLTIQLFKCPFTQIHTNFQIEKLWPTFRHGILRKRDADSLFKFLLFIIRQPYVVLFFCYGLACLNSMPLYYNLYIIFGKIEELKKKNCRKIASLFSSNLFEVNLVF